MAPSTTVPAQDRQDTVVARFQCRFTAAAGLAIIGLGFPSSTSVLPTSGPDPPAHNQHTRPPTRQDVAGAVAVLLVLRLREQARVVALLHYHKCDGRRVCADGDGGRGRREGGEV